MADDEHGGSPAVSAADAGVDAAQKDASLNEARSSESPQESPSSPRTFVSYTRPQILALYNSPLVKPLDHMPSIKDWFGCVAPAIGASRCLQCYTESGLNKTINRTGVAAAETLSL